MGAAGLRAWRRSDLGPRAQSSIAIACRFHRVGTDLGLRGPLPTARCQRPASCAAPEGAGLARGKRAADRVKAPPSRPHPQRLSRECLI
ncbi:hypothetical protein Mapa_013659 [Marchantia paleacea]|nr:hypothetical protein Mapa_013659 [Marchantia paleacea]